MFGFQKIIVISTLAISTFASPRHQRNEDSLVDWNRLSNLIDTIDGGILHEVLHSLTPKFQDGIFSKDRSAVEVVHSENPIVASKLVYIAKRQSNTTTTDVLASSSSSIAASSTASSVSAALSSQITATILPSPTSILVAPTTPAGASKVSSLSNGAVYSTSGGLITITSSMVGVSFTRSTSTSTYYTTLSDGTVMTSTSIIVVNAPVTATATGDSGSGTSSTAGLQNHAAKATGMTYMGMLAGAVGLVAAAM